MYVIDVKCCSKKKAFWSRQACPGCPARWECMSMFGYKICCQQVSL